MPTQVMRLAGHAAAVRAIDVDPVTDTTYTASDDRCVRVWSEGEQMGGQGDRLVGHFTEGSQPGGDSAFYM